MWKWLPRKAPVPFGFGCTSTPRALPRCLQVIAGFGIVRRGRFGAGFQRVCLGLFICFGRCSGVCLNVGMTWQLLGFCSGDWNSSNPAKNVKPDTICTLTSFLIAEQIERDCNYNKRSRLAACTISYLIKMENAIGWTRSSPFPLRSLIFPPRFRSLIPLIDFTSLRRMRWAHREVDEDVKRTKRARRVGPHSDCLPGDWRRQMRIGSLTGNCDGKRDANPTMPEPDANLAVCCGLIRKVVGLRKLSRWKC